MQADVQLRDELAEVGLVCSELFLFGCRAEGESRDEVEDHADLLHNGSAADLDRWNRRR